MMTPDQLITCFANEDKSLRQTLDFLLDVFEQYKVFKSTPSKRHFIEISREIYFEATTELELSALQKALWWCYESAVLDLPHLLQPVQTIRLLPPEPFFNESTARVGDIAAVLAYFQPLLAHSETTLRQLATALLLAKHVAVTRVQQLFCIDEIVVMPDANRALVPHGDGYLMLDATGLLLWRRLHKSRISADQLRAAYADIYSPEFGRLRTLDDAISVIGLMQQPLFYHELNPISCPLSAQEVLAHLTNQPNKNKNEVSDKSSKRRKRRVIFGTREQVQTAAFLAFGHCQDDAVVMSGLSLCLRRFQQQSENEHRNTRAFNICKAELQVLLQKSRSCSGICGVLLNYCISLFLHGSAWKARLAVNTVLTYLSTLQQFCINVFNDEALLQLAQSEGDALADLTELIEDYLVTLAPDKQNTVLIFLQFVSEYVPIRLVGESLDVISEKVAVTRTHYLSPMLFEQAITAVSDVSTQWFLRICYFLGLRHDEAMTLFVDDVSAEFLYVTKRSKRKSRTSVRRVSLMFMPADVRSAFLQFVAMRRQHSIKIFSPRVIAFYLPSALAALRKLAGNNQFVVHSLRHCAANNMLFMLMIAAFDSSDWRERYALFQHQLFSDDTISQLKEQFRRVGHPLLPQASVFNILACQLGHASPVVSAACYLHFLPFLAFELNSLRTEAPDRDMLTLLLSANSYRYELLSQQQFDETRWFKHASRGLQKKIVRNVVDGSEEASTFSFSDYVTALHAFLTTNQSSAVFQHSQDVPSISAKTLTQMLNKRLTLQQIEFISKQRWTAKSIRALNTLQELVNQGHEIRDVRTLRHVLFALNSIGFSRLQAVVSLPRSNQQLLAWQGVAQRFDCQLQFEVSNPDGPRISLSSFKTTKKSLLHLFELIQLVCSYICYQGKFHG